MGRFIICTFPTSIIGWCSEWEWCGMGM